MAKDSANRTPDRKSQWFARRQIYLRSGQDSQYVELSSGLQIGVALGFGALALWLIGASYSTLARSADDDENLALLTQLSSVEQTLDEVERERDAALEQGAQVAVLEAALAEAEAKTTDIPSREKAEALTAELARSEAQIEDLQRRLSESKANQAALQAKFEAETLANADTSEKTAEEASGLHTQLEEAFNELETLRQQKDEAAVELETLSEEATAKDEAIERNSALLKAATAEIERLQDAVALADTEIEDSVKDREATIETLKQELDDAVQARTALEGQAATLQAELQEAKAVAEENVKGRASAIETLTEELDGAVAARTELERETEQLRAEIEEVRIKSAELEEKESAAYVDAQTAIDATIEAQTIKADLREADLLATIESLREELEGSPSPAANEENEAVVDATELTTLKKQVAVAEAEIERLLLIGLKADDDPAAPSPEGDDSADETEELRSALLAAEADIIKLNADVKAAKQRLAEQSAAQNGEASKPDNTAKLQQQLASTRSRVQQLNKALADAKLREVAIDLALINVVPTPSPPAPR